MGLGASGARFGTTIAELGDVDGDGFKGKHFSIFNNQFFYEIKMFNLPIK